MQWEAGVWAFVQAEDGELQCVSYNPGVRRNNSWILKVERNGQSDPAVWLFFTKTCCESHPLGLGCCFTCVVYLWLWEEEKLLFESFILHSIVWNYTHLSFPDIYCASMCCCATLQSLQQLCLEYSISFCCLHGGTVLLIKMPCQTCVIGMLSSLSHVRIVLGPTVS